MRQQKYLTGIALLLLILAACASPAAPASSGGRLGPIVFSSDRDAAYSGIYVMNSDGSGVTRVATGDSNYFAGPWALARGRRGGGPGKRDRQVPPGPGAPGMGTEQEVKRELSPLGARDAPS